MRIKVGTRHYGWVIFSLSVTNLLVEGGIKNTVPVVYVALRGSFHWSAAATAGIFSLGGLTGAQCAPLLGGWLFDLQGHYGAAYLLAVALVCVAIGCMWGVRLTGGQAHD